MQSRPVSLLLDILAHDLDVDRCMPLNLVQLPVASGTFLDLINALADDGYREGVDLFGAPYDFRLAADGLRQVS